MTLAGSPGTARWRRVVCFGGGWFRQNPTGFALAGTAKAQGENWRYVCFNRPLAEALRTTLPELKARISTFHELAIGALGAASGQVIRLIFPSPTLFPLPSMRLSRIRAGWPGLMGC